MAEIEMEIDSIRVSLMNYQRVVVLKEKDTDRYLPIWIDPNAADSINVKIQGIHVPRPLTHDFICVIIDALGANVKAAIIDKLKGDTFHAKVVVVVNSKQIEIDCRPSDALAVAVRVAAPIFAAEKVLAKAGIFLDEEGKLSYADKSEMKEPSKFAIFSESTHDIINKSEEEAKRLNHNYVGTGHILLALTKKIPTAANEVLKNLGINLPKFPARIEASMGHRPSIESAETGLTSAAKKTIELSMEESIRLGSDRVQPEHILIGLVRQNKGIAADLLKNLDINVERIYIELIRLYTRQQPNPYEI